MLNGFLIIHLFGINIGALIRPLNVQARYTAQNSPYTHSSLKFVRQLLNSTLFSAPPFQYTGKSGRALCTEYRAGLAKVLPPHPTEGGKKCCRRVSSYIYTYVREKFSVLRVGVWGGRVDACAFAPPHSWRDSPGEDFVLDAGLYIIWHRNFT